MAKIQSSIVKSRFNLISCLYLKIFNKIELLWGNFCDFKQQVILNLEFIMEDTD